jgi:hypothetical protein
VSYRTGINGQSVLLSARSLLLRASAPPTTSPTIYSWTMASSAVYGGGALWVLTLDGLRARVNPATGVVWAEETVISQQPQLAIVLAANKTAGQVTAVIGAAGSAEVVSISPPYTCWS